MEAMFLLIAISVVFVVAIGAAFWWAIFAGQFDNSDAAAQSILHDDESPSGPESGKQNMEAAGPDHVAGSVVQQHTSSAQADEAARVQMPK